MSEKSDQMMNLLQELAVSKKTDLAEGNAPITEKRRKEISEEMKALASRKSEPEQ